VILGILVGATLVAVLLLAYVVWRIGGMAVLVMASLRDEIKVLNEHLGIQPLAAWTEWLKTQSRKRAQRADRSSPMM
jgi:hypothetical protein